MERSVKKGVSLPAFMASEISKAAQAQGVSFSAVVVSLLRKAGVRDSQAPADHVTEDGNRVRYLRCGKRGCPKCPHGPYLYSPAGKYLGKMAGKA